MQVVVGAVCNIAAAVVEQVSVAAGAEAGKQPAVVAELRPLAEVDTVQAEQVLALVEVPVVAVEHCWGLDTFNSPYVYLCL